MYIPAHFKEERAEAIARCIATHPLAALIVHAADGLSANHLPMLYDADANRLVGHIARANPLWKTCGEGEEALAIFGGPEAYVSPSWYPSKTAGGKVVPTWNYAVVHVHGRISFTEDKEWLRGLVTRLTTRFESPRAAPWKVTDAPADYVDAMLGAIVGLELAIERIEAKSKLSQNRGRADFEGVVAGLSEEAPEVAEWMRGLGT
jgi:transcriptional regulator